MEGLKVGASYLRKLSSETLAALKENVVIHVEGVPVAVIMPWAEHERLVGLAPVLIDRSPSESSPELRAHVQELVAQMKELPRLAEIGELLGHLIEPLKGERAPSVTPVLPVSAKTQGCKHCGAMFAGPKSATICADCKASGHTLTPAECPRCTEGAAI